MPQCHDRLGARVAWVALRTTLRRAYESLLVAVSSHRNWNEDAVGTAFGAIAHAAYHLGAMRQRLPPHGGESIIQTIALSSINRDGGI